GDCDGRCSVDCRIRRGRPVRLGPCPRASVLRRDGRRRPVESDTRKGPQEGRGYSNTASVPVAPGTPVIDSTADADRAGTSISAPGVIATPGQRAHLPMPPRINWRLVARAAIVIGVLGRLSLYFWHEPWTPHHPDEDVLQ